jgi:O-antigen/teichoic acid export membrane protein
MLKLLLKDSAIYMVPSVVSRGLSLILIPFYTRVLSPTDYGSLDLLFVFSSVVNLTIALEVSQGVARFFASENNYDKKIGYASSAFWFTCACYSLFAILILSFSNDVATLIMGQESLELEFKIGIIFISLNGIFYIVQNQLRWELRSKQYSIVSLFTILLTSIISFWLVYFQNWGLLGLLVGMAIGSIPSIALGLWWLRKSFQFRFDLNLLKEMLVYSTPLVFSGIAVWVNLYVDRIMINHFLSIEEVGLYGIGHRLASVSILMMVGFQGALMPLIYANYKNANTPRQLEKIFRLFLSMALLMFLTLTLFAIDILELFTTPAFYGGSVVVIFLVPAILLSKMYIFSPGISIAKKTYLLAWINVGGGALNIMLNFLLIPSMGIKGAGVATMVSYLVFFSAYTVVGNRYYPIPHNWGKIFMAVALAVTLALIVPHLLQSYFLSRVLYLAVLFVFPFILIVIGLIRLDELSIAWQIVKKNFSST